MSQLSAMDIRRQRRAERLKNNSSSTSENNINGTIRTDSISSSAFSSTSSSSSSSSNNKFRLSTNISSFNNNGKNAGGLASLIRSNSCPPGGPTTGGFTKPLPFQTFRPEKSSVIRNTTGTTSMTSTSSTSFLSPGSHFRRTGTTNDEDNYPKDDPDASVNSLRSSNSNSNSNSGLPRKRKFSGSTHRRQQKHTKTDSNDGNGNGNENDALARLDDLLNEADFMTVGGGESSMSSTTTNHNNHNDNNDNHHQHNRRMSLSSSLSTTKPSTREHHQNQKEKNDVSARWMTETNAPIDWNIKKSMVVTSSWPFHWMDTVNERHKSTGVALSLTNQPSFLHEEEEEDDEASSNDLQGKSRVRTWRHVIESSQALKTNNGRKKKTSMTGMEKMSFSNKLECELYRSMTYHVHPSGLLPAPMLALKRLLSKRNGDGRGENNNGRNKSMAASTLSAYFTQRKNEWRESFLGLYTMLKTGTCDHFYYRTTQFSVLFKRHTTTTKKKEDDEDDDNDEDDEDEDMDQDEEEEGERVTTLCAVMSPSTKKIRSDLGIRDITFAMPLLPGGVLSEEEIQDRNDILAELRALEASSSSSMSQSSYVKTKRSRKGAISKMDKSTGQESTLTFNGIWTMDGLFDYLLDYGIKGVQRHNPGQLFDLPQLLSEVPFRNSANRQLRIVSNAKVTVTDGKTENILRPPFNITNTNKDSTSSLAALSSSSSSSLSSSSSNVRHVHMIEFEGPLLPTMIPRLLSSLLKCQKQKIIQFREKLLKEKAEDEEEDEDAGTMEDNDNAEKKEDTDVHLDLNIDLKPQINSFGHNVVNDISIEKIKEDATGMKKIKKMFGDTDQNQKSEEEEKGETDKDDKEDDDTENGETVERLFRSTIVRMDLSIKIPVLEKKIKQKGKRKRRSSKNKIPKLQEEEKEMRIRYLTKSDPSSRVKH